MLVVLALDIIATFLWDRLMLMIFAPKILRASFEGTTWKDVINYLRVIVISGVVIYFLATVSERLQYKLVPRFSVSLWDDNQVLY